MGSCQNYGPLLGTLNYNRDPKRDPNFDNHPHDKSPEPVFVGHSDASGGRRLRAVCGFGGYVVLGSTT